MSPVWASGADSGRGLSRLVIAGRIDSRYFTRTRVIAQRRACRDGGMTDQPVVPVILCGGAGTRLWPVSRETMPKQLVPLIGTSSTFQKVLDRVICAGLFAPPIVVAEQARARGVKATHRPGQRRDSMAAIAAASCNIGAGALFFGGQHSL